MKMRTLGKSGYQVSEIGLGCWQLGGDFGPIGDERAKDVLDAAAQSGINFWDTADVYGAGTSESRIGKWTSSGDTKPIVATKVGKNAELHPDGYTRENVRRSLEGSAKRLGVETIDLVQLHCVPPEVLFAGDIIAWLEELQKEGLIRHIGASVEGIEEAKFVAKAPGMTSIQLIFNVFRQNPITQVFPLAMENDVGIIVRLPLASGVLAGKMKKDQVFDPSDHRNYNRHGEAFSQGETFSGIEFEKAVDLVEEMRQWQPEGMSMAQMAMRWILDHPAVTTVITGASRPAQVLENAAVSELDALPEALHERLGAWYKSDVEPHICVPI